MKPLKFRPTSSGRPAPLEPLTPLKSTDLQLPRRNAGPLTIFSTKMKVSFGRIYHAPHGRTAQTSTGVHRHSRTLDGVADLRCTCPGDLMCVTEGCSERACKTISSHTQVDFGAVLPSDPVATATTAPCEFGRVICPRHKITVRQALERRFDPDAQTDRTRQGRHGAHTVSVAHRRIPFTICRLHSIPPRRRDTPPRPSPAACRLSHSRAVTTLTLHGRAPVARSILSIQHDRLFWRVTSLSSFTLSTLSLPMVCLSGHDAPISPPRCLGSFPSPPVGAARRSREVAVGEQFDRDHVHKYSRLHIQFTTICSYASRSPCCTAGR